MEFNKIETGLNFPCIKGNMVEDKDNMYLRKIRGNSLSDFDFQSRYEKNDPLDRNDNTTICMHRGVSVHILKNNESNKNEIISHYKQIFGYTKRLSPKFAKKLIYYCSFKFLLNAGLLWDTSSEKHPCHRTFMKSDEFRLNIHIRKISIETL